MAVRCGKCGNLSTDFLRPENSYHIIDQISYCGVCSNLIAEEKSRLIKATSTNNIDGYFVQDYIDIESIEIVIGTGIFSEWSSEVSDFFGTRSTGFELKLQKAKKAALMQMKMSAYQKGGNAVIGIDIDYTEFSGNRIGVVINGTIVKIVPISEVKFAQYTSLREDSDNFEALPEL